MTQGGKKLYKQNWLNERKEIVSTGYLKGWKCFVYFFFLSLENKQLSENNAKVYQLKGIGLDHFKMYWILIMPRKGTCNKQNKKNRIW